MGPPQLFIAIEVPKALHNTIKDVEKLMSEHLGNDLQVTSPENLHITLRFLGKLGAIQTEKIITALDKFESHGSFDIHLQGIGGFPSNSSPRILWSGVQSQNLMKLKTEIDTSIFQDGFPPEPQFIPHLTLTKIKKEKYKDASNFIKNNLNLKIGSFTTDKITLKQSILSSTGARYQTIKDVKL